MAIATAQKFAIFDDIQGLREDIPNIKLSKAFSPESENVLLRYGGVHRMRGRLKELLEAAYTTGTISVESGRATVTGSSTAWYTSATHYPAWGSDDCQSGRKITIADVEYTIKSVDSATQITLSAVYAGSTDSGLSYSIGTANQKIQTPDGNPIIRYHTHLAANGTQYFLGRTKNHIYLWSSSWSAWMDKTLSGGLSDATLVETVSFNKKVLMTDGVNKVLVWAEATPNSAFACLDGASGLDLDGGTTHLTVAKYLTVYEGYIHLGYTTEGGTVYPFRDRWCSLGDETDWDESGTGDTGAVDFYGQYKLKGFGHYKARGANLLVIFKERGPAKIMWLVESSDVFNSDDIDSPGLLATHSVVNDKAGELYYMAADYTIRKLYFSESLSKGIDRTLRALCITYQDNIEAAFIDTFNQLWWSIPKDANSTGNDKIIAYQIDEKIWQHHSFPIRCFGDYYRQSSYTIDTIPYTTIDGIEWASIDAIENVVGFPLDIASDYSGYSFDLHSADNDDTASYTSKFVLTTDLAEKGALAWYKRISNIQLYFNRQNSGSVNVYIKEDNALSWTSLGSVALTGDNAIIIKDLPCDLRGKTFLLKIETTNYFESLGVIFDFESDGDR